MDCFLSRQPSGEIASLQAGALAAVPRRLPHLELLVVGVLERLEARRYLAVVDLDEQHEVVLPVEEKPDQFGQLRAPELSLVQEEQEPPDSRATPLLSSNARIAIEFTAIQQQVARPAPSSLLLAREIGSAADLSRCSAGRPRCR